MAKKKILLLSDDLRMHSGIATQSKTIVMNTLHHYDWAQIAGAIKHPDKGKIMDMRESLEKDLGMKDVYCRLYPVDGYGSPEVLREVMQLENPDAILHYTDPRFWGWLYQMEHELRREIPIYYYNIWDDLPYPRWNEPFYESCDLIMNISKQTHNIVNKVCRTKPRTDWDSTYVPHGIETKTFHPIDRKDKDLVKFSKNVFQGNTYDFVVFWNNRNIKRKLPADVIMAYKYFCDMLPEDKAKKCVLIMHTAPKDPNGTDLPAVVEELCPIHDIIFSHQGLSDKELCYLYNLSDVTINMASNEGFGLGTCESLHCGTPISVNVTGGLQDQCGFKYKDKFITYKDYDWIESLHNQRKWKDNPDLTWGEWCKPVWPANRSIQGSLPTPYIWDDRPDAEDFADVLKEWYDMGREERDRCGMLGHDWVNGEESMMSSEWLGKNFIDHMETAFEKWQPRKRFTMYKA
jgi:glycosyltransferase involved in cell wall biosynthesis